jgi:hypothetical protein
LAGVVARFAARAVVPVPALRARGVWCACHARGAVASAHTLQIFVETAFF